MSDEVSAADGPDWTVRLTEAERRSVVSAIESNIAQGDVAIARLKGNADPLAREIVDDLRSHLRELRRVLAKVSE